MPQRRRQAAAQPPRWVTHLVNDPGSSAEILAVHQLEGHTGRNGVSVSLI